MPDQKAIKPLRIFSQKEVLRSSGQMITDLKEGRIKYLKTPWDCVNDALNGGYMPQRVNGIAGPSGHGKTYFMQSLQKHILDSNENSRWLEFQFDMPRYMSGLRMLQKESGIPLPVMLSANEPIYDATVQKLRGISKVLSNLPIDIVDEPGTLDQMDATILEYREMYPDEQIMVSIDHALLVLASAGDNEIETMVRLSRYMRRWVKDYKVTLFPLFQGNSEIENDYRTSPNNPAGHIPKKRDVFGSKQAFHVSDTMIFLHQPVLLGITEYGPEQIPTRYQGDNVLAVTVMKNRLGPQNAQTFLQTDLANGKYINLGTEALKKGKPEESPGLFDNLPGNGVRTNWDLDDDDIISGLDGI
jgi:replicative DNA helicase